MNNHLLIAPRFASMLMFLAESMIKARMGKLI